MFVEASGPLQAKGSQKWHALQHSKQRTYACANDTELFTSEHITYLSFPARVLCQ